MSRLKPPSANDSLESIIRKIYDDMNTIASAVQSEKPTAKAERLNDMRFVKDQRTGESLIEVRFKEGWKQFVAKESIVE